MKKGTCVQPKKRQQWQTLFYMQNTFLDSTLTPPDQSKLWICVDVCVCECDAREFVCVSERWAVFILYSFDTYFSNFTIVGAAVAVVAAVADLLSLCVFFRSFISFTKPTWVMMHYDSMRARRHVTFCIAMLLEHTKFNKLLLDFCFFSCIFFSPFSSPFLPSFTKSGRIRRNRSSLSVSV